MNFQEKFDDIIESIEYLIEFQHEDIPAALAKEVGINLRLLADAFMFITDITLIKYIRQRRLAYALDNRISNGWSIEKTSELAGFSDAAAFSKACKNELGYSPSQITQEVLAQYAPLSFSKIMSNSDYKFTEENIVTATSNSICGVTARQFAEIKCVLEIGALYGFSDEEAELVYRLSQECSMSIQQAADFCEDLFMQMDNGTYWGGYDVLSVAKLSIKYNLSVSESIEILSELNLNDYSLDELPEEFFEIYFSDINEKFAGFSVPTICEIVRALKRNDLSTDEFDDIMSYSMICNDDPIETINNYRRLQEEEADFEMLHESLNIPDDDTDGFGYRSIWEIPEKEMY